MPANLEKTQQWPQNCSFHSNLKERQCQRMFKVLHNCTHLLSPRDFSSKSTGVGCHFILWRIFPTQGSNLGLPHCRQTLYSLSHQESVRWVQLCGSLNILWHCLSLRLELSGEFIISSVLSCHRKNLKWWMDQCYSSVLLASKGKYILEEWGQAVKRRETSSSILAPLLVCFSLPLEPALCKLG